MNAAQVRETHVGVVFLLGDRAYKMKKPVRTGFLDFSTRERRLSALRRELELNRRLAPDVYLGISDVSQPRMDGGSPLVADHLLVMRRMPADRRLATRVQAGADVGPALRQLARRMAAFHASAARGPEITAEGGRAALSRRWCDNLDQTRALRGTVLDESAFDAVERAALMFLAGRGPLFEQRCASGRIVDGHGDLIAEDVFCLDDGPRILDCLEFEDRLRYVDVLDDVAFLAMDLERLGAPDRAAEFLAAYLEFSGDPAPVALRHHYVAYRAFVRAKVACLRHEQGDPDASTDAAHHLDLARRHVERGAVRLALVGGLPGTGKTTVAGRLADRFGAVLLSSDRIRKELAGLDPTAPAGAAYAEGLYSPANTAALYEELLRRAAALLGRGESVILDASWTSARCRLAAEDRARRSHCELVQVQCRTTAEDAAQRIHARRSTTSDATAPIAAAMAAAADDWPQALAVPTGGAIEESVDRAASAW